VGEFNSQPLAMLEISNFGTILGSVNTGGGNFTNTGFFQGSADLDGARLSNEGTFSVTEDFVVSGDFSQSTGLLKFSIGGVSDSEFGSLNVSGQGTFGGSLQIELLASYAANVGDRFLLITGNANAFSLGSPTVVGGFDGVQGMTSIEGNSLYFEVTAVPEPAPMICLLLTALFALMRRTRSRAGLAELTRFVRTD
jgi:hypothetical protein